MRNQNLLKLTKKNSKQFSSIFINHLEDVEYFFHKVQICGGHIIYSHEISKHIITEHVSKGIVRWSSAKYNLGQKVGDKLTKLSKVGFSMECFTADFLQFFTKKCQNLAFGWTTGYSPSNPSISGIFWKFPNFLRS